MCTAVLMSYVPSLEKTAFEQLITGAMPQNKQHALHNAQLVVNALTSLGVDYRITASDIVVSIHYL